MSYCRWSDSDVYIYDSCEGGMRFFVSGGFDKSLDRLCVTYNEAYQYAKRLRDEHGLNVPDYAIKALREDALEEAVRITGLGSAVADLIAKNANLHELVAGLTWCAERTCGIECPLYDKSEPDHCREQRLKRELGIEVDE